MNIKDKGYVTPDYLQDVAKITTEIKNKTYKKMNISKGDTVLDFGCGPGTDTISLSKLVGSEGKVIGLDIDEEMVDLANEKASDLSNVHHFCISIDKVDQYDNYFDSCRSDRVFQHLTAPRYTLNKLCGMVKPGGRLVIADTDWGSFSVDSNDRMERFIAKELSTNCVNNGFSGRTLYRLFKDQDLKDIEIEVVPMVILDYNLYKATVDAINLKELFTLPYEYDNYNRSLERSDTFYACVNTVIVSGTK